MTVSANRHDDIIAAVATLTVEVAHIMKAQAAMLSKLEAIEAKLVVHNEHILTWKRDGKWLASALTGLGALGAIGVAFAHDWFTAFLSK